MFFHLLCIYTVMTGLSFQSVAFPILDSAANCENNLLGRHPSDLVESRKLADRILKLRNNGVTERVITAHADQQDLIYVYGVPADVKEIKHEGKIVFRHYSKDFIPAILKSQSLKAGPRPFIDPEAHARREYQDLTGVMFTDVNFDPADLGMGIKKTDGWVDFTLPPETPVLRCKNGNYLIPAQKDYPEWVRQAYAKYRQTGTVSMPNLREEFKRIDAMGGMKPQAEFKINIVGYQ